LEFGDTVEYWGPMFAKDLIDELEVHGCCEPLYATPHNGVGHRLIDGRYERAAEPSLRVMDQNSGF